MHHTLLHTVVYGTHSGWCRQERNKVARELKHKVFCQVWSVLKEVLVKKAENDSPCCFSWLEMSICYLASISVLSICTVHSQLCSHNLQIWYKQSSCLIFYSVLTIWCRVSFKRKCCRATRITLRTEVSSQEMKKTYTTEHQPEMVPCSALRAPLWIPPPWFTYCIVCTRRYNAYTRRRNINIVFAVSL